MIQNALLSTSCAAKPFLAVFRHELQYKKNKFHVNDSTYYSYKRRRGGGEGGGGVGKKLFKLQGDNFKHCIAQATSVRYPAHHLQHHVVGQN